MTPSALNQGHDLSWSGFFDFYRLGFDTAFHSARKRAILLRIMSGYLHVLFATYTCDRLAVWPLVGLVVFAGLHVVINAKTSGVRWFVTTISGAFVDAMFTTPLVVMTVTHATFFPTRFGTFRLGAVFSLEAMSTDTGFALVLNRFLTH